MLTTRLPALAALFAILCAWPMITLGQIAARPAQVGNSALQDHCTDLDRNEVPCPNEVSPQAPSQAELRRASRAPVNDDEPFRLPKDMGSADVPLDSWVYPAFDRLAALGYAPTAFADLRPWTRMECARLVSEAGEALQDDGRSSQAKSLYTALATEFAGENSRIEQGVNRLARVDSVYSRTLGIAGPALNQSYYFGQSLINDYGRPYAEGFNSVDGISAEAATGPLAFYVRGEYQHAPSAPGLPLAALQAIATDYWHEPAPSGAPTPQINQVRLLEAYGAFQNNNWQISFGRQSLWWGPGASGPLMFSNNAAPITMFRVSQVSGGRLPFPFSYLGPIRSEFFVGRLQGQHFVNLGGTQRAGTANSPLSNQPFVHGEKFSFKPTENLEFGVSRTGVFGGPGFPITLHRLLGVFFSTGNSFGSNDPGDRRAGFDFSYRIPYLRKWLVLYNDSMSEDEISPIGYPRRSAMNPGIYVPQIPKLNKLDFRAEAVYTDLPGLVPQGFYYFNVRYADGYTNQGNILGSWVGREGRGLQLSSTYWFSPRNTVRFEYRGQRVDPQFLKGGTLDGFTAKTDFVLRPGVFLSSSVQYQRWTFPVLANGTQSLLTSTVQLTYEPRW